MNYFTKSFDNIFNASEAIYNSLNLANMMLNICRMGNFLNKGTCAGNAAGFKLSCLIKLCDLKSNRNEITLLHLILEVRSENY
jgi:hypothetical protein